MKVTLRKRNQGKQISLYLDYYEKGRRKTESLKLYLDPNPKTKTAKDLNKHTLQLAESIRAKRLLEIQNGRYGFDSKAKLDASFYRYVEHLTQKRFKSEGNYGNWDSMLKHLKKYMVTDKPFHEIDRSFVQGFKDYLDDSATRKNKKQLSQNSKYSYFNKFRAAIKQAVKDGILSTNPTIGVTSFNQSEPQREFLTLEELQQLASIECDLPELKSAFLFSCLTGLRWSDIEKLVWSEIQHSDSMGYYIRFRQKKTQGVETLPISEEAYTLLGEKNTDNTPVFANLKYSAWHNSKLREWVLKAEIHKHITFHSARHTYATLQLTLGTDIYTVSKLLGHKELKTTQIYAKVIDHKKREAANKISLKS